MCINGNRLSEVAHLVMNPRSTLNLDSEQPFYIQPNKRKLFIVKKDASTELTNLDLDDFVHIATGLIDNRVSLLGDLYALTRNFSKEQRNPLLIEKVNFIIEHSTEKKPPNRLIDNQVITKNHVAFVYLYCLKEVKLLIDGLEEVIKKEESGNHIELKHHELRPEGIEVCRNSIIYANAVKLLLGHLTYQPKEEEISPKDSTNLYSSIRGRGSNPNNPNDKTLTSKLNEITSFLSNPNNTENLEKFISKEKRTINLSSLLEHVREILELEIKDTRQKINNYKSSTYIPLSRETMPSI